MTSALWLFPSDRSGRALLSSPGRPSVAGRDERRRFWAAIAVGLESEDAAMEAGVPPAVGTRWFRTLRRRSGCAHPGDRSRCRRTPAAWILEPSACWAKAVSLSKVMDLRSA